MSTTNHTGVVLALDQATNTGWAVGEIGQPFVTLPMEIAAGGARAEIVSGTTRTPDTDTMRGFLFRMIREHGVRGIVYESPIKEQTRRGKDGKSRGTSLATARRLYALADAIESIARRHGLWVAEYGRSSAYADVMGKGHGRDSKEQARDHLRALGFNPRTLDESDAIIHWHAAAMVLREKGW